MRGEKVSVEHDYTDLGPQLTVKCRLGEIRLQKVEDGKPIPYRVVSKVTGISANTLVNITKGRAVMMSLRVMGLLCWFYDVPLGEMFELVSDEQAGEE